MENDQNNENRQQEDQAFSECEKKAEISGSEENAATPEKTNRPAAEEGIADADHERAAIASAVQKELSRINALDPSIKSFDDIFDSDTGPMFTEKVRRGYSLYDAFLVANQKKILKNVTDAVHQSALNNVNSKMHLTGTNDSKAEAPVEVPSKTSALYRSMFPELSDQQIRSHYAKHNKK